MGGAAATEIKRNASRKGSICLERDIVLPDERVVGIVRAGADRETRPKLARQGAPIPRAGLIGTHLKHLVEHAPKGMQYARRALSGEPVTSGWRV